MSHPNRAFWEAVSLAGLLLFVLLASVLHLNNWCRRNDSDSDGPADSDDKPEKRKKDKESKEDKDRRKDVADEDGGDTSVPSTASTVPDTPSTSADTPSSETSEREKPRDRDRDRQRSAPSEDEWEEGEERRLVPDGSGAPPPRRERRRSLSFNVGGTPVTLAMPEGARDFQVDTEHHGSGQSTPVSGLTTPASPAGVHHPPRSPGPDGDGGGATLGGGGSNGAAYPAGQATAQQRALGRDGSNGRTVDGAHQRPGHAYNAAISSPLRGPNDLTVFSAFPDDSYYDKLQQELERFLSGTTGKTGAKGDAIFGDNGAEGAKRRLSAEVKEPTKAKVKTEPVPAGLSPITVNAHHVKHVEEPEVIPASPEKITVLSAVQPPEPLSAVLPDKKGKKKKEKEKKRPPPLNLEDEVEEAEKAGKTKKKKVVAIQESSPEVVSPEEVKKKKKKEEEPASPEKAKAKKSNKASEVSDAEEEKKVKKKAGKAKVKVKDAEEESEDEEVKEAKKAKLAKKEKAKAKVEAAESKLEERLQALEEAKAEQEKAEKEAKKAKAKAKEKEKGKGKGEKGKEKDEAKAKDELAEWLKELGEAMAKKEEAEKEVVKKKEKVEKKKKKLKATEEEKEEVEEEDEVADKGTKKAATKKKGKSGDKVEVDAPKKAKKGKVAPKVDADDDEEDEEVDIGDVGRKPKKEKVKAAPAPAEKPAQVYQQPPPAAQQVPVMQAVPPSPAYQYTQQQPPFQQQQVPFYQQQNIPPASQQAQDPPAQGPNVPVRTYQDSGSGSRVKKRQPKSSAQDEDVDGDQEYGQDIKSRKPLKKGSKKDKVAVVGDAGDHSGEERVLTDIRAKAKQARDKLKDEAHQRKRGKERGRGREVADGKFGDGTEVDADTDGDEEACVSAEELSSKRGKSRTMRKVGLGAEAGVPTTAQEGMKEMEEEEEEEDVGVDVDELETRRGRRMEFSKEKAKETKMVEVDTSTSSGAPTKPGVEMPVAEVAVPANKASEKSSQDQAQAPASNTEIAEYVPAPVRSSANKPAAAKDSIPMTPSEPANEPSEDLQNIPADSELGPPQSTPPALDPPPYQSRARRTEDVLQDARDDYGSVPEPFPEDYVAAWKNPAEQKGKKVEDQKAADPPLPAEASSPPRRAQTEKDVGIQGNSMSKTSKNRDAGAGAGLHELQGKQGVSLADCTPEQSSFKQNHAESDGPRTPLSARSYQRPANPGAAVSKGLWQQPGKTDDRPAAEKATVVPPQGDELETKERPSLWQKPQKLDNSPSDTAPSLWQGKWRDGPNIISPDDVSHVGMNESKDIPTMLSDSASQDTIRLWEKPDKPESPGPAAPGLWQGTGLSKRSKDDGGERTQQFQSDGDKDVDVVTTEKESLPDNGEKPGLWERPQDHKIQADSPAGLWQGTGLSKNSKNDGGETTEQVLNKGRKGVGAAEAEENSSSDMVERSGLWKRSQNDERQADTAPGLWGGTSRSKPTMPPAKNNTSQPDAGELQDTVHATQRAVDSGSDTSDTADSLGFWQKSQDPDSPRPNAGGLWQAKNSSRSKQEPPTVDKGLAFPNSPSHDEPPVKAPTHEYDLPVEEDIIVTNAAVREARGNETQPGLWKAAKNPDNKSAAGKLWESKKNDNSSTTPSGQDGRDGPTPDEDDTDMEPGSTTTSQPSNKTMPTEPRSKRGEKSTDNSSNPKDDQYESVEQETLETEEVLTEEKSGKGKRVKEGGRSKTGKRETEKKNKESKQKELDADGPTMHQEGSDSELDPALKNISHRFQDIMKDKPRSKKSDKVIEDFNGRSKEEQDEWVKDKLQGVQDAVEEERGKQTKTRAQGIDPPAGKKKDGKSNGDGKDVEAVNAARQDEGFRNGPREVPTMAHKNWKSDKKNVVHQESPPKTNKDNQSSRNNTVGVQKSNNISSDRETGTQEQEFQASYLYPLASLGKFMSVFRHAPLFSALTLLCLGAGIEGTRQLGGLVIALSQGQTTLSKRDSEPADVTALESYILKVANGAGVDSMVGVFLLHVWLALCIPFLACLCYLCVERASRAGTGQALQEEKEKKSWRESWWANPWSTLKSGFNTLNAGIYQGTSIIFLGSEYKGVSSIFRSTWYWPALRFTIFTANLVICILLLRQAISLAYMVITSASTPFFSGPDTSATASSLAAASSLFTSAQMFFILHIILAIMVPCLAVSWYALLNPHAKKQAQDGEGMEGDAEGHEDDERDKDGSQVKRRGWLSRLFCCGVLDNLGPMWVKWVVVVVVLLLALVPVIWLVTKDRSTTGQASG